MAPLLHYYRLAALHDDAALQKKAAQLGYDVLSSEYCFNIELTAPLVGDEVQKLEYLLRETFEPEKFSSSSMLGNASGACAIMEVGPRQQFTSAWSTNACSICASMGLDKITRIERSRRYLVRSAGSPREFVILHTAESYRKLAALVHDRMTECLYPSGIDSFESPAEAEGWTVVPVKEKGPQALADLSKECGLGYDAQDLEYYVRVFRDELGRDPTTVECFDLAQGNSEHSRHWFFGGKVVIDGKEMPSTLFQLVKKPFKEHPANSVIAFKDNSSALRGFQHTAFFPDQKDPSKPGAFKEVQRDYDVTCTVETHNFPCGIAPFPGAETGAGGRMRDGESTGKGSLVVAGIAGYAVGNLHMEGYDLEWEKKEPAEYPSNMAQPLQILVDSSNGASDYGNKFGEPLLCGWTRTFGHRLPSGERFEWVKPIMLSGGLGAIDHGHLEKEEPKAGMLIVKIGGPAYRIGVGGGAASSMVAGDNAAELDFNAVQRGDAEMLQKVNRVIRACCELGPDNPILSIHDQGAGGSGNVLFFFYDTACSEIYIRKMLKGDPSMTLLELWTAEFQENDALLINPESTELWDSICKRERAPYSIVGKITGDGRVVVKDERDNTVPVDLPLDKVLGSMPQKVFPMTRITQPTRELALPANLLVETALTMGVLRLVSVGSKRFLTNKVDRSVTGLVAQQQCVGPLQTPLANFAMIAQSMMGNTGGATAIGEQPMKGLLGNPEGCRAMARLAVAEAITNLLWVKIPTLDSIKASGNWMWAAKLEGEGPKMYDAAEALSDLMCELGVCIDGGKDSLSMAARVPLPDGKSETVKSPGQLVITAYAPVPDVTVKVTPDLKTYGDGVLLFVDLGVGAAKLGGSALVQVIGQASAGDIPDVSGPALKAAFDATQSLLAGGLLSAGHDRSDGGLIVTVLEMAFAGRCGVSMRLPEASGEAMFAALFGEAPGLVYEVKRSKLAEAYKVFDAHGVNVMEIGETRSDMKVVVSVGRECVLDNDVVTLHDIWEATSFRLEREQCNIACVEEEESGFKDRKHPPWELTYTPSPTAQTVFNKGRELQVAIIRQEGSNGDREMAASFHMAGFEAWDVHMTDLLEGKTSLDKFRGVAFVGGFSYADTLDSAKGWAGSVLFSPALKAQFQAFRERADSFSLGVCNGCQFMALLGWVPGTSSTASSESLPLEQQPRFVHNKSGRFESRFVTVRVEKSAATKVWLKGMEGSKLGVWVNHGEGRAHFPNSAVYDTVQRRGLVPMRYVDDDGNKTQKYPFNPNGSPDAIVGLCSHDGRHMAMMPHPERLTVFPWQWPYAPQSWMEGDQKLEASPWLKLFQNVREWCESSGKVPDAKAKVAPVKKEVPAYAPGARKVLGSEVAKQFQKELQESLASCKVAPKLVGILANQDPAAAKYAEWTKKTFERDGLRFELREVDPLQLDAAVEKANKDPDVHGVMIYYPVFGPRPSFDGPSQDDVLRDEVSLCKDVEGLCHFYRRSMYRNERFVDAGSTKCVLPCTPLAVVKVLDYLNVYDKSLPTGDQMQGKTVVVINRSEVVGRPLAAMLANDGAKVYSVDIDSTFLFQRGELPSVLNDSLESQVRSADVVVLGVPSDKYKLNPAWIKEGATVVNVASHKNIDENVLLSTRPGVKFIGAVGAVTVAMLQRNLVRLYNNFGTNAAFATLDANQAMLSMTGAGKFAPPSRIAGAGALKEATTGDSWLTQTAELGLNELAAVTPVDGRYRRNTKQLAGFFSEFGLIRYRVHVEIEYFLALMETLPDGKNLPAGTAEKLRAIPAKMTTADAEEIKATEKITNHDVKAVEYFIKKRFDELGLVPFKEFVHFALTSQDINNTSNPLILKNALETCFLPSLEKVLSALREKLPEWDMAMLARTHGQPASPTNLAKEMKVFVERLEAQLVLLRQVPHSCKFGGATGNMNAHLVTYPNVDWRAFANNFCEKHLGLKRQQYTTQIEHYDNMGAVFDTVKRINTILLDFCRDIWMYVSTDYFKQKIVAGEIGSSAMPHKVNPIDFENAEGNLGMANATFEHLSQKLPISRLQRDLTDSTVLRNIGVPFAHSMIALSSIQRGLGKLLVNKAAIDADLEKNWVVVAEALQSILRREGYPNAYEVLKDLTRTNEAMNQARIHAFVDGLQVSDQIKQELKAVSPFNYIGYK